MPFRGRCPVEEVQNEEAEPSLDVQVRITPKSAVEPFEQPEESLLEPESENEFDFEFVTVPTTPEEAPRIQEIDDTGTFDRIVPVDKNTEDDNDETDPRIIPEEE